MTGTEQHLLLLGSLIHVMAENHQVSDPREVGRQCTKYLRRLATQDCLDNESIQPAKYGRCKLASRVKFGLLHQPYTTATALCKSTEF